VRALRRGWSPPPDRVARRASHDRRDSYCSRRARRRRRRSKDRTTCPAPRCSNRHVCHSGPMSRVSLWSSPARSGPRSSSEQSARAIPHPRPRPDRATARRAGPSLLAAGPHPRQAHRPWLPAPDNPAVLRRRRLPRLRRGKRGKGRPHPCPRADRKQPSLTPNPALRLPARADRPLKLRRFVGRHGEELRSARLHDARLHFSHERRGNSHSGECP
jgi:hypothetical protein